MFFTTTGSQTHVAITINSFAVVAPCPPPRIEFTGGE